MLICWSTGPTDPILNKSKKNNITKFGPTGFLLIYYFLLFEKKERKEEIKHENQEVFIVIIINYKLRVFLLCLPCKILFF